MNALLRHAAWLAIAAFFALPASAQTTARLQPQSFHVLIGQPLTLSWQRTGPSQPEPWPENSCRWFFARVAGTQENRDSIPASPAPPAPANASPVPDDAPAAPPNNQTNPSAIWTFDKPGTAMVGLDLRPSIELIEPATLRAFLESHAAPTCLALLEHAGDDALLRIKRLESAKTFIRVFDALGQPVESGASETPASKSGQHVEVRTLMDPTAAAIGSDIPCRVYEKGDAVAGGRLLATHVATNTTQSVIADAKGIVNFRLSDPGEWRLEFHHAEALKDDPEASLVLYSATLTFNAGGAK